MKSFKLYILIMIVILALTACTGLFTEPGIITSPFNNQTVRGQQTILVTPPENTMVDYVNFYINDILQYEDTTDPYSYEWETFSEINGWRLIYVELYSIENDMITDSIRVLVDNDQ